MYCAGCIQATSDEVDKLEQKEFDKVVNDFDGQLSTHVRTTDEKFQDLQFRRVQDEFNEHLCGMNKVMEIHAEERQIALVKQQHTRNALAALQESTLETEIERAKEYNELTRKMKETGQEDISDGH